MSKRNGIWWQGAWWPDPRGTRAWRTLRDQVIADEPLCWLHLPGCTRASTTADHVVPYIERPDLAMSRTNLRGACLPCNSRRGRKAVADVATTNTAEALAFFD